MQELLDFTNPYTVIKVIFAGMVLLAVLILVASFILDKIMCRAEQKKLEIATLAPSDEPQSLALKPILLGATA